MRFLPIFTAPSFRLPLPPHALALLAALAALNLLVWAAAAAVLLTTHPSLLSPAALSYTLGLRHALDADHIAAIDLATRRLVGLGQRPATVGTFFSLGHSTVVLVTCVAVAATSGALRGRFDAFSRVGNIIGTSISASVLLLLCLANAYILASLVTSLRAELRRVPAADTATGPNHDSNHDPASAGIMTRLLRSLFKAVDRPWKMYPLGVVFGLGFDTSSEIAILGISSLQALRGTSIWLILIFPILFTSAMSLLDTLDGTSMLTLYTSPAFSRDPLALLYYQVVLSAITVLASAFVATIQLLSLVQNVADPHGPVWDGLTAVTDHFDVVGGCICGLFLLVAVTSAVLYRPWRRRMERRRQRAVVVAAGETAAEEEGTATTCESPPRLGLGSPGGQPEAEGGGVAEEAARPSAVTK